MRNHEPKTIKNRQTWREQFQKFQGTFEYKHLNVEAILEICFEASIRRTYPNFLWNIASKVEIIGAKCDLNPSVAGYKVSSQDNCHEQSRGGNEGK